jgi:1,4-dihydroxy-2-naphthoyl-CoA hydrolase
MSIWRQPPDLAAAQSMLEGTIASHLGIRVTAIGDDYLEASMPVDARTRQPMGILHGGASVVLAETVGSMAANMVVDVTQNYCVGLEVNANHLGSVREGLVHARAMPVHLGRSTQVWEIRLRDDDGRPSCISRLTMAVLSHRR